VAVRTTSDVDCRTISLPRHAGDPAAAADWRRTVVQCFAAFALGSFANGAPFVVVMATLESAGAGAGWVAAVAVARLVPYLVCSPASGAIAGRCDPRALFACAALACGCCSIGTGAALATAAPPAVLVLTVFAVAACGTPLYPALMRLVHESVPASSRDRVSAAAAGLESASFWAGPALGGALLAASSWWAMVTCASMSVAAAATARGIARTGRAAPSGGPPHAIRGATAWLVAPIVRPAMLSVLGVNVLGGLLAVLLVRIPAELHLGGAREYGLLSIAQGCGAVVALAAVVGPVRLVRRPLLPVAAAGAAVVTLAGGSALMVALIACAVFGASVMAAEALAASVLCCDIPEHYVAPAFGVLDSGMVAAMVVGSSAAPVLVTTIGLQPSLAVAGAATVLFAVVGSRRAHRSTS
jgi:MFS family permease